MCIVYSCGERLSTQQLYGECLARYERLGDAEAWSQGQAGSLETAIEEALAIEL